MRIIIIRHGEPDYAKDSLTENGFKEAHALSKRLLKEKIDYVYISPLGRAKDTAKEYLKQSQKQFMVLDWLKEFPYKIEDEESHYLEFLGILKWNILLLKKKCMIIVDILNCLFLKIPKFMKDIITL